MTVLLEFVFWSAALLVVYPYLVYPPLLRLLAGDDDDHTDAVDDDVLPRVSFVVSAYNEEEVIARKLDNTAALDYPADRIEVLVVSDASSDATDDIVTERAAADARIRLLRQADRRGKSSGLNDAVANATGDIVIFSDANAMYEPGAVRMLAARFAEPKVGYAVGAAHYSDSGESEVKASEGLYWQFELWLKRLESRFHSVVGGDGAIYAIRRALFWDLLEDDISDFANPMQIVAHGYRGEFVPEARCFEESADSFGKEFGRKRRIVNRSWRAVKRYAGRLRPVEHGRFVFMLVSHKIVRWFAMPLIVVALGANAALVASTGSALYVTTLVLALLTLALAAFGFNLDRRGSTMPRLVYIPYYFYFVNLAGMLGIWDETRGVRHATWDHVRTE